MERTAESNHFSSTRNIAAMIFATAILMRFALFAYLNRWHVIMRSELEQAAMALAQGTGLANPYAIPTGPTAHVAPAYPFVLSLIYRIFGTGEPAEWADQIFSVLCVAIVFSLLPYVSELLLKRRTPGVLAGFAMSLSPASFLVETQGKESPFTSLCVVLFVVLAVRWWRRPGLPAVGLGCAGGFLLLVYPGLLTALVVLCGFSLLIGARAKTVLTWIVCGVAVLVPWTIRNYSTLGHVVFIRDNVNLELAISNNDLASAYKDLNEGKSTHPWENADEARRVIALGEYNYEQERGREFREWVSAHREKFLKLTAERAVLLWFPYKAKKSTSLWYSLLSLAAFLGLALLIRRDVRFAVLAAVWAVYFAPYMLIQADLRYMYPLLWTIYLTASWAAYYLWITYRNSNSGGRSELAEAITK